MIWYVNKTQNSDNSYGIAQSSYFENSYQLTDEQVTFLVERNGFVNITEESDPNIKGSFVTLTENTEDWETWKSNQPDKLPSLKEEKIVKSKEDLAVFLINNPLLWSDGEYYSITQEKQNQLTSKIMAATMAQQSEMEYKLTWNSTGEVCKEWALEDLSALAFAIDATVTKLVTYQQKKEIEIKNCTTEEELEAIVVDYSSVLNNE